MAALGLQAVIHGTFMAYTHSQCRCDPCKNAFDVHRRHNFDTRRWYHDLTKEQRRSCQVCHIPIAVHPIRACWREA